MRILNTLPEEAIGCKEHGPYYKPKVGMQLFRRKSDLPTFFFALALKSAAIYSVGWEVYQRVTTRWLQPQRKFSQ